ncbi:hypothetical protein FXO38_06517 [Capsicum annuum]|nr:hypothetical protein FXO37_25252 [Capsicum annuum]KAF3671590.1 hypothetical protein FXO38_06517 [Capsicum annuum]
MVEFASSVKGITLNLDNEIVWIVLFSSDIAIKNGDLVKRTRSIMDVPVEKAMLGSEALDGPVSSDSHYRWMVRHTQAMVWPITSGAWLGSSCWSILAQRLKFILSFLLGVPEETSLLEAVSNEAQVQSLPLWTETMQRYQKLMPYHLAILHKPILDGRNGDMGKEEAGLKERSELCKDVGI